MNMYIRYVYKYGKYEINIKNLKTKQLKQRNMI